jgi:hypothetical protein
MNEKKNGVWNNMGKASDWFKENGIDTTTVTVSAAKILVLPPEVWNPQDIPEEQEFVFEDIGRSLCFLAAKNFEEFGYVDLDKVWVLITPEQLAPVLANAAGFGDEDVPELIKRIAVWKEDYKNPFGGNKAYKGVAFVTKNKDGLYGWKAKYQTEKKDANKQTVKDKDGNIILNNATVEFKIWSFHSADLGCVDDIHESLDTHEKVVAKGEPNWILFKPFISKEQDDSFLGHIKKCQEGEGRFDEIEGIYIVAPNLGFDKKYKSLKGNINTLWC